MKELNVNKESCIGCGACVAIDPEHFDFDEDGHSEVISQENVNTESAQNAISSCPTNAISYVESVKDEEKQPCEDCEKKGCCNHDEGLEAA